MFLLRRSLSDGVYFQILISLSLSGFSALTSIAVLFADATSPLSPNDLKHLGKEYDYQSPDTSNALEAIDAPAPM